MHRNSSTRERQGPDLDYGRGFAKLACDLRVHPIMRRHAVLAVYIWLLCRVRHQPGLVDLITGPVMLDAGQTVYGQRQIGEALGLGRTAIRTAERWLEGAGFLTREPTHHGTLVTLRGYADFSERPDATQPTEHPTPDPHPIHTRPAPILLSRGNRGSRDNREESSPGTASPPSSAAADSVACEGGNHSNEHTDHAEEDERTTSRGRRGTPPAEAIELADALRQHLLSQKPDHALRRPEKWRATTGAWIRQMAALLRTDKRDPAKAREILAWLAGDQGGVEDKYRFVVESPRAFREKWDRIETAMARRRNGKPPTMARPLTAEEELRGWRVLR